MEIKNNSLFIKSLIITFLYVGIGTLSLFLTSMGVLNNEILEIVFLFVNILTMPVIFLGFGILYGGGGGFLAFLIQMVVFLLFWFAVYRYLLKEVHFNT